MLDHIRSSFTTEQIIWNIKELESLSQRGPQIEIFYFFSARSGIAAKSYKRLSPNFKNDSNNSPIPPLIVTRGHRVRNLVSVFDYSGISAAVILKRNNMSEI